MKKILLSTFVLLMCITHAKAETLSNYTTPTDFANDLWLDYDFAELAVGETFAIDAERVPQIIDNSSNNNVAEPKYNYTVIEGTSVSVSEAGVVTANAVGRSLIEVTYDAIETYGVNYAAISPINTAYMVVNVVETKETDITINHSLPATNTYETFYYSFGNAYQYRFTVSAENATSTIVKCNGKVLEEDAENAGEYLAMLENRTNVIEITASNESSSTMTAVCLDARKIDVNVENVTNPGKDIAVGDKVHISFNGIVPPIYKLAKIYNPTSDFGWGDPYTRCEYANEQLGTVESNFEMSQYELNKHNTIEITFTEKGEYVFNNGYIRASWWGSPLGSEKDGSTSEGLAPTNNLPISKLPAFKLYVHETLPTENEEFSVLDLNNPTTPEEFTFTEKGEWDETYTLNTYEYIQSQEFMFGHNLDNAEYAWSGYTVANSSDNNHTSSADAVLDQFNVMAKGGKDGEGSNYLIATTPNGWTPPFAPNLDLSIIKFNDNKARTFQGVYINTTAILAQCVLGDNKFSRLFEQGDSAIVTFHAELNGELTGKTLNYCLVDYRAAATNDFIINTQWEWVDLSSLGEITALRVSMTSSDMSEYGYNTPSVCAFDKFVVTKDGSTTNNNNTMDNTLINVYPNPCVDYIIVETPSSEMISIYNTQGQIVLQEMSQAGANRISVEGLSNGTYIVRCGEHTTKLIK